MPACPVCDAEFDTVNSVIAHMSSSKGEHEGIGYQKARAMLEARGAGADPSPESSAPDSTPPDNPGPEGGDVLPSEFPDNPSPDPAPEPDGCPECGGSDYFDVSEHFDQYSKGCPACSTADNWVVW